MSDFGNIETMFAEIGGWDTSLPFGLKCDTACLKDGLYFERNDTSANITSNVSSVPSEEEIVGQHYEVPKPFKQTDDGQTDITSTTASVPSEEEIGTPFNDNTAQDDEKLEPKGQVNEEPGKKFEEVVQQAWTEFKESKAAPQTGQEETVRIDSQKTDSQEQAGQKTARLGFFERFMPPSRPESPDAKKWLIGGFVVVTLISGVILSYKKN